MADQSWQEANRKILDRLDIAAEYRALGLRIAKSSPNPKGWIECHAMGREDHTPSAGINVGDGPSRGRYQDFASTEGSVSLFDFAAAHGKFADWRAARNHYAEKAGIELPSGEEELTADKFEFSKLTPGVVLTWCKTKKGIKPKAVLQAGGVAARWPAKLSAEFSQSLIAFPMYGTALLDADPVAWHSVQAGGGKIRRYRGKAKPPQDIDKMTVGSPGLLNAWALRHLPAASLVWVVEGLSDLLALQSALGDRTDHVVISSGASSYQPKKEWANLFAGKQVNIVPHADNPGQSAAAVWTATLVAQADEVRKVKLPYPVAEKHGKDLRDYLNEGHTYDDLFKLAENTETTEAEIGCDSFLEPDTVANAYKMPAGEGETVIHIPMTDLVERTARQTDDWPRRVGGDLFVHDDCGLSFLHRPQELFAFLHRKVGNVDWHRGTKTVTKEEFFSNLQQVATKYEAIEELPHFPPPGRKDFYYAHPPIKPGSGEYLQKLLDRFSPATNIDRDLILAAFMTAFWSGQGGPRPAFLFTSPDGRGAGKTKTAEMIGHLAGGVFDFSQGEEIATIKKRLLTSEAATKRVCMLDNLKTTKFSWKEFEAMITSSWISGHRLYRGERSRPNTFLWLLTLNGPALSRDIAQRVIPIAIRRPEYESTWEATTKGFIDRYRWQVISDLAAMFEADQHPPAHASRWSAWEREILSRLPEPNEAQTVIQERQAEFDVDAEEGDVVEDFFRERLEQLGYDAGQDSVHIPSRIAAGWLSRALNEKISAVKMARLVRQWADEKLLTHLNINPTRKHGRGLIWVPKEDEFVTGTYYDVEERLSHWHPDKERGLWDE